MEAHGNTQRLRQNPVVGGDVDAVVAVAPPGLGLHGGDQIRTLVVFAEPDAGLLDGVTDDERHHGHAVRHLAPDRALAAFKTGHFTFPET